MNFVNVPLPGMGNLQPATDSRGHGLLPITAAARRSFWNRVLTNTGGCWLWTGAVGSSGYGRITWTSEGESRTLSTHRFALTLASGAELPSRLVAAHGCDNPLCVRVGGGHVHLSTQSDNLAHAVASGRHEGVTTVNDSRHRRNQSLALRSQHTGSTEPYNHNYADSRTLW